MSTLEFLTAVPPFKELLPAELHRLFAAAARCEFAPGDAIAVQDEPATECFVIASGSAAVTRGRTGTSHVAVLKPGDLFGEIALIDGSRRSATVTALEPTECFVLPAGALQDCLAANRAFSFALLQMAVLRLAELERAAEG